MAKVRKSSLVAADRGTNYLGRQFIKNADFVEGNSATYIAKGDIVSISGLAGAYPTVVLADSTVAAEDDMLFVASSEIREFGTIEGWQFLSDVDTSTGAAGGPVYLSEAEPGKWTTDSASGIKVGKVLAVDASTGVVLLRPLV
jgi:hypothetical protein